MLARICLAAFCFGLMVADAGASLIGTDVTMRYYHTAGDPFDPIHANRPAPFHGPDTFTVSGGIELDCSGISSSPSVMCLANFGGHAFDFIDIGESSIRIDWANEGQFYSAQFNGIVFSGLSQAATGLTYSCLDVNSANCIAEVTYGTDALLGNYVAADFGSCTPVLGGQSGQQCRPTTMTIDLQGLTAVPLPAALPLFLMGLFGLLIRLSRRSV